jgi:hypothetical protein
MRRIALTFVLGLGSGTCLLADFSYEHTTTMTGGAMAGMMRTFSKQAREPIKTSIAVKGDRMVSVSPTTGSIIDLGKETITQIDFQKKTYSVLTFAQFAESLNQVTKRNEAELTIKPSLKETGQKRMVAGMDARQVILTMEMEGTDKKTGKPTTVMTMTSDMWVASNVPGYEEVRNFYKRMIAKMNWAPSMGMTAPGSAKGMTEMMKEMSKIEGVPVYQVVKMGSAMGAQPGAEGAAPEQQQQQGQQAEAEKPSSGGALGRLGGLGGLGGFGRKKKQEDQPASAQGGPAGSGSLMEFTSEASGFSTAPVDPSKFNVPAGFKQVEGDLLKGGRR